MNTGGHTAPGQRIWAVGGGKGGIGKSLVSANLAIALASLGKQVVAVDLDLGNANMHTCLGIRYPRASIVDFLNGSVQDLREVLTDTSVYNLKLISGSAGIMGAANPWHAQKLKLLRSLEKLLVDYIIIDLGAGTSYNTIDFFLSASDHIIVSTPENTSIQSAYNFVRICLFRKLHAQFHQNAAAWSVIEQARIPSSQGGILKFREIMKDVAAIDPDGAREFTNFLDTFKPSLIMNMVLKKDEETLGWGLKQVIKRYLDVEVDYTGSISFDKAIRESLAEEIPYIINQPKGRSATEFYSILARMLGDGANVGDLRDTIRREIIEQNKTYRSRIIESRNRDVDPAIYILDKVRDADGGEKRDEGGFFAAASSTWSKIAIDIGTANTLIYVKGKGIVLNEPTIMSLEEGNSKVVALGHEAKAMLGRSHSNIRIIAPMDKGAISDYRDIKVMIQEFIKRAKRSTILIRPGVVLTIPMGLTSVERKAVQDFVRELGARETHLVYEPFAAAIGAGLPVDIPKASMLVNIGAGSTSAVVISISGIVAWSSARTGSRAVDTAIIRHLRDTHNFCVGDQTAEWVKTSFAQAMKIGRDRQFIVRGQDLALSIPRTLNVGTAEIRDAIQKPVNDMLKVILTLLESVPPELSGDLVDRGMILAGSGAYLKGLDRLIADTTGIRVSIAPNAATAAVEGAGRMLDDFKLYQKFFADEIESAGLDASAHR